MCIYIIYIYIYILYIYIIYMPYVIYAGPTSTGFAMTFMIYDI